MRPLSFFAGLRGFNLGLEILSDFLLPSLGVALKASSVSQDEGLSQEEEDQDRELETESALTVRLQKPPETSNLRPQAIVLFG